LSSKKDIITLKQVCLGEICKKLFILFSNNKKNSNDLILENTGIFNFKINILI